MPLDQSFIGAVSEPVVYEIEKGHIRLFADAIGDPNPIYRDVAAARAAGYRNIPVPPTFPTILRAGAEIRAKMNLDWRYILHGEQEFRYLGDICAGDVITARLKIADIYTKSGGSGKMDFIVQETDCTNQDGRLVMQQRSVTVYRWPKEEK